MCTRLRLVIVKVWMGLKRECSSQAELNLDFNILLDLGSSRFFKFENLLFFNYQKSNPCFHQLKINELNIIGWNQNLLLNYTCLKWRLKNMLIIVNDIERDIILTCKFRLIIFFRQLNNFCCFWMKREVFFFEFNFWNYFYCYIKKGIVFKTLSTLVNKIDIKATALFNCIIIRWSFDLKCFLSLRKYGLHIIKKNSP